MKVYNLRSYTFYPYETTTDDEGCESEGYSSTPQTVSAYVYPAGGRMQAEMYGARLNYMLNMMVNLHTEIAEQDGICIDSDSINYRVVSIEKYSNHAQITLEKVSV